MSCTFVTAAAATLTVASSATTGAITTTAAHLLHADISIYTVTASFSSFADSKTNTWATGNAALSGASTNNQIRQLYAKNCLGGASHTFTLTLSTNGYAAFSVTEIAGASTTSPVRDTGAASDGSNTTTHSVSTAGSSAASGDIAIGLIGDNNTGGTITVGAGYTQIYNNPNITTTGLEDAYLQISSGGTQTYAPTTANSVKCNMQVIVYSPPATGFAHSYGAVVG